MRLIRSLGILVLLPALALAGPAEEGADAYRKGDYPEAVALFRKGADQGNSLGQFGLGLCYENGNGVSADPVQAAAWYRKAADQGYDRAQFNLGACYDKGLGVPRDLAQAMAWYRKAAEQGYAAAQYNLGPGAGQGQRLRAQGPAHIRRDRDSRALAGRENASSPVRGIRSSCPVWLEFTCQREGTAY